MWRKIGWSGLMVLSGFFLGAGVVRAEVPTYHRDVSRILQNNCQDCHRPGQVAPFSLLTFEQARKRASDIVRITEDRKMPPWPASTEAGGPFRDARLLSSSEIETLDRWVEAGCPEGDAKDAPPARLGLRLAARRAGSRHQNARALHSRVRRARRAPRLRHPLRTDRGEMDPGR